MAYSTRTDIEDIFGTINVQTWGNLDAGDVEVYVVVDTNATPTSTTTPSTTTNTTRIMSTTVLLRRSLLRPLLN